MDERKEEHSMRMRSPRTTKDSVVVMQSAAEFRCIQCHVNHKTCTEPIKSSRTPFWGLHFYPKFIDQDEISAPRFKGWGWKRLNVPRFLIQIRTVTTVWECAETSVLPSSSLLINSSDRRGAQMPQLSSGNFCLTYICGQHKLETGAKSRRGILGLL